MMAKNIGRIFRISGRFLCGAGKAAAGLLLLLLELLAAGGVGVCLLEEALAGAVCFLLAAGVLPVAAYQLSFGKKRAGGVWLAAGLALFIGGLRQYSRVDGLSPEEDLCQDMGVCSAALVSEEECRASGGKWRQAEGKGVCYMKWSVLFEKI